ncbi:MAG: hypothetical protein ABWX92_17335, partial [Mycetocola sp.]
GRDVHVRSNFLVEGVADPGLLGWWGVRGMVGVVRLFGAEFAVVAGAMSFRQLWPVVGVR